MAVSTDAMRTGSLLWFALIRLLPPQLISLLPTIIPTRSGAIVFNEPLGEPQWLAISIGVRIVAVLAGVTVKHSSDTKNKHSPTDQPA